MTKKGDLISLIIPVYNAEKFLDESLNCVINQTYENLEIILVNDGSTDKSLEIMQRFAKNDSRIVIINQKNTGQARARNNAVKKSKAEYISFMDADDIIDENYVSEMKMAMDKTKSDIVMSAISSFEGELDRKKLTKYDTNRVEIVHDPLEFFVKNYHGNGGFNIAPQAMNTKIFKKFLLENLDFTIIKTNILEDNFITLQILARVKPDKIATISRTMYFYRVHENSTMRDAFRGKIQYGNKKISYDELFREVVKYMCKIFAKNRNIDEYVNIITCNEYLERSENMIALQHALQQYADHQNEVIADLRKHADGLAEQLNNSNDHLMELTVKLKKIEKSRVYTIYRAILMIKNKLSNIRRKK